jgi:SWIB/MDM2 domain
MHHPHSPLSTMTTTTTTTSPSPSASRLHSLIDAYHEKIFQIEELERKVDARAAQTRRRLANLLDAHHPSHQSHHQSLPHQNRPQSASHRSSHIRIFVTHKLVPPPPPPPQDPSAPYLVMPDPPPPEYKLQVEGRLLVGHLDHESAAAYDLRTEYVAPADDLDRSKGEQEEPDVAAIHCTHFFSRAVVQWEPLYVQKPNPMSKKAPVKAKVPPPAGKKSRRGSSSTSSSNKSSSANPAPVPFEEEVDPATLVRGSVTTMEWTRTMTGDAHLWCFHYKMPAPPGYHLMPHSVMATVRLYSARHDDLWLPKDTVPGLVTLFSSHITADEPVAASATAAAAAPAIPGAGGSGSGTAPAAAGSSSSKSKKRKADEAVATATAASSSSGAAGAASAGAPDDSATFARPTTPPDRPPLSLDNSIDIPQGLTWREIGKAFCVYIQDRDLTDPNDKATVVCDDLLRQLFQVDRFPFAQLHRLLTHHQLFISISSEPVELTYLLKPETALPNNDRQLTKAQHRELHYSLLQLDMDVSVPSLFPFRCRELLRRIKRRELEYTSSRTKARYLLMARRAKSEDSVKTLIDDVVGGRAIDRELQPVLAALAKSTPPNTEARMAAHCDMRMSYLLERVREQVAEAQEAWDVVDAAFARIGAGASQPNGLANVESEPAPDTAADT